MTKRERLDWYIPRDWRFLLVLQFLVPTVAIITACFAPYLICVRQGDTTLFWIALVLSVSGISALFIAKLPLYRQGKYFSLGCKGLPAGHRRLYWAAYVLLGLSVFIMLMLLAVVKMM